MAASPRHQYAKMTQHRFSKLRLTGDCRVTQHEIDLQTPCDLSRDSALLPGTTSPVNGGRNPDDEINAQAAVILVCMALPPPPPPPPPPPDLCALLGDSGGVVNSLDFCPASLMSLGCFYFWCVLSSQSVEGGDSEFANFTLPTLKAFFESRSHNVSGNKQ